MGFTRTSEGRVFFKNADNDDIQFTEGGKKKSSPPSDPVMPSDNTQMQILLLLKSLNTKLKSSKSSQQNMKSQLDDYKKTIKTLEAKATEQETNYIDLESKISRKQSEANKKATRVESSIKTTLKQLEEAKDLVKELEEKSKSQDDSLEDIKSKITEQTTKEKEILKKQKALETKVDEQQTKENEILKKQKALEAKQKEQGEKMVDNVAAYVALTKRVSESETRQESLDNKIEEATSEYMKLDRKLEKVIEDRNRILRKVDRIEQAVLETRDALNAKAMVLLTDQGAVAGVNMPNVTDETFKTDPTVLNRRLQEEALMPWWRRPVRIQGASLILIGLGILMLGWIMNEIQGPSIILETTKAPPPTISLNSDTSSSYRRVEDTSMAAVPQSPSSDALETYDTAPYAVDPVEESLYTPETTSPGYESASASVDEDMSADFGIKIHKGNSTSQETTGTQKLDIHNEEEMLAALESDPERVARRLNEIEPASLTTEDHVAPPEAVPPVQQEPVAKPVTPEIQADEGYVRELRTRIQPDPNLTETAKKIEEKAFLGVPEAQHDMGAIYVAGHGKIQQDLDRAIFWFTEAANNNVSNAKYNLGVLYHQGMGVNQSIEKAITLYREAADLGHPEAQYNLGIANIEGIGVAYNPERAAYFFESAANKGITEAAYNLGLIYENGLLGSTRPDDALAWYKTAADQGSPEAQSALDQLAASLGIGINDVNRIVEKLQKSRGNTIQSASYKERVRMVKQVQEELMRRGLYPGPVDGMIGPMTANAIKEFQKAASLDINGEPSEELLTFLKASSVY